MSTFTRDLIHMQRLVRTYIENTKDVYRVVQNSLYLAKRGTPPGEEPPSQPARLLPVAFADEFQVDMLGVRYKSVNFGKEASLIAHIRLGISEQLLRRNVNRFRCGFVSQTHRLLHHSILGSRVIKKKRRLGGPGNYASR